MTLLENNETLPNAESSSISNRTQNHTKKEHQTASNNDFNDAAKLVIQSNVLEPTNVMHPFNEMYTLVNIAISTIDLLLNTQLVSYFFFRCHRHFSIEFCICMLSVLKNRNSLGVSAFLMPPKCIHTLYTIRCKRLRS